MVALDINGTIVDGDSLNPALVGLSTSLTEQARELITDITQRISVARQDVCVVLFTLGNEWPGVVREIEELSGGVISFDRGTGRANVGRAAGANPPAVFLRALVEHTTDARPFEHDGIVYDDGNPTWRDPGPSLSYEEFRERTMGQHLVLRGAYDSGNDAVVGWRDHTLAVKLLVSEVPVLVFDDYPRDWEVVSRKQRIVKAISPANANGAEMATDFCKELALFEASL